jgi:hypothetical protein
MEASTREATAVRERVIANVRHEEDWATPAEREARQRVSRVEAESVVALTSSHGVTGHLAGRVSLLKGELVEVCQSRDVTEEKSWGLTEAMADTERWLEDSKRECH